MIEGLNINAAEAALALRRRPEVMRRGRALRRRRRAMVTTVTGVVVLGGLGIAGGLATRSETSGVHTVDSPTDPTPSTPPVPASVTGTEQKLETIAVPPQLSEVLNRRLQAFEPHPGTLKAFAVNGSPGFVVYDGTTPADSRAGPPLDYAIGMYQSRETVGFGAGIQSIPIPLDGVLSGARAAVFLFDLWPEKGQQGYAWSHLPVAAAFVTYTWEGTQLWERPTNGVAAFVMQRPAQFDGPTYADWHTARVPVLRAFDAAGKQLAQANAPRMLGDDFLISPDAPQK